ncbi:hypothetical protein ebA1496 [Aromatoleum aromaticum EbN1]|uniref:Uncharacterized protein n=1 Tax=Aromatoleum aromaticum (strain DSM 19018 / LMG 30748 / EbN1) TaxID=76114 RepID=Q5P6W4_AROAE|nr:hypothetical protein ebA1496 [Aromatoleum aromaticum EbN1]
MAAAKRSRSCRVRASFTSSGKMNRSSGLFSRICRHRLPGQPPTRNKNHRVRQHHPQRTAPHAPGHRHPRHGQQQHRPPGRHTYRQPALALQAVQQGHQHDVTQGEGQHPEHPGQQRARRSKSLAEHPGHQPFAARRRDRHHHRPHREKPHRQPTGQPPQLPPARHAATFAHRAHAPQLAEPPQQHIAQGRGEQQAGLGQTGARSVERQILRIDEAPAPATQHHHIPLQQPHRQSTHQQEGPHPAIRHARTRSRRPYQPRAPPEHDHHHQAQRPGREDPAQFPPRQARHNQHDQASGHQAPRALPRGLDPERARRTHPARNQVHHRHATHASQRCGQGRTATAAKHERRHRQPRGHHQDMQQRIRHQPTQLAARGATPHAGAIQQGRPAPLDQNQAQRAQIEQEHVNAEGLGAQDPPQQQQQAERHPGAKPRPQRLPTHRA